MTNHDVETHREQKVNYLWAKAFADIVTIGHSFSPNCLLSLTACTFAGTFCCCGMLSRCSSSFNATVLPVDTEQVQLFPFSCVINNCCSGPAWGQTDLAVSSFTAAFSLLLRNYPPFHSCVMQVERKKYTTAALEDSSKLQLAFWTWHNQRKWLFCLFGFCFLHRHLFFFPFCLPRCQLSRLCFTLYLCQSGHMAHEIACVGEREERRIGCHVLCAYKPKWLDGYLSMTLGNTAIVVIQATERGLSENRTWSCPRTRSTLWFDPPLLCLPHG